MTTKRTAYYVRQACLRNSLLTALTKVVQHVLLANKLVVRHVRNAELVTTAQAKQIWSAKNVALDIIRIKKVCHLVLNVFQVDIKIIQVNPSVRNVSRVTMMQVKLQQEMHRQCAKNVSTNVFLSSVANDMHIIKKHF